MSEPVETLLQRLRRDGWSVAVHNDYRLNGEAKTFWLFTHACGRWIKGEGTTDDEALRIVLAQASAPTPDVGAQGEPVAWAYEVYDPGDEADKGHPDDWHLVVRFYDPRTHQRADKIRNVRALGYLDEAPAAPRAESGVSAEGAL